MNWSPVNCDWPQGDALTWPSNTHTHISIGGHLQLISRPHTTRANEVAQPQMSHSNKDRTRNPMLHGQRRASPNIPWASSLSHNYSPTICERSPPETNHGNMVVTGQGHTYIHAHTHSPPHYRIFIMEIVDRRWHR